jgi:hypothetical protein
MTLELDPPAGLLCAATEVLDAGGLLLAVAAFGVRLSGPPASTTGGRVLDVAVSRTVVGERAPLPVNTGYYRLGFTLNPLPGSR